MTRPRWLESMIDRGPVLTDGAWGTELQARGLEAGEQPDLWNVRFPDRVEEVARAYAEAGSQVILTNTFRANRIALGAGEEVAAVNRAGVEASRRGAEGRARVFASIGPSGKLLLTGDVDEGVLRAAFTEQARVLASAGADAIVVETMSDLAEAVVAIDAALETGIPVVACMVFDSGKARDRTMMGHTPEECARALAQSGADVIGANCGVGIEQMIPICSRLADSVSLPIWIKPNAGLPELRGGEVVYDTSPDEFAAWLDPLIEAGAAFVGGCCGTSPKFIEALHRRLSNGGPGGGRVAP